MRRMMIQADEELLARLRRRASERGVSAAQVVRDALADHLGTDAAPPPATIIGSIGSKRGDLSRRASDDEYEPEPFR